MSSSSSAHLTYLLRGRGGAPRPPRPCHHGTALTTTITGSNTNAASAAAATPAAAATLASQGAGATSTHTHPHRGKHRGDVCLKGADAYTLMAEEHTSYLFPYDWASARESRSTEKCDDGSKQGGGGHSAAS